MEHDNDNDNVYTNAMPEAERQSSVALTKTPHYSPSRGSYGVPFVSIWETIDRVIAALHYISQLLHRVRRIHLIVLKNEMMIYHTKTRNIAVYIAYVIYHICKIS